MRIQRGIPELQQKPASASCRFQSVKAKEASEANPFGRCEEEVIVSVREIVIWCSAVLCSEQASPWCAGKAGFVLIVMTAVSKLIETQKKEKDVMRQESRASAQHAAHLDYFCVFAWHSGQETFRKGTEECG